VVFRLAIAPAKLKEIIYFSFCSGVIFYEGRNIFSFLDQRLFFLLPMLASFNEQKIYGSEANVNLRRKPSAN